MLIDNQLMNDLIQSGKDLCLRRGHRDSKDWVEFERLINQVELETLQDRELVNIAPALVEAGGCAPHVSAR